MTDDTLSPRQRDAFGLSPAEYWTNPRRTIADVAWDCIGDHRTGILLGGPPSLDVEVRETLPMLAYHSDTTAGIIAQPFHHAVAVGSRIDRAALRAAVAGDPPNEPMGGGEEPRVPSPGFTGEPHDLEMRDLLALPWEPGEWRFTLLLGDRISNAVQVALTHGALRYVDPEVERVLAERRAMRPPLNVDPPIGHPLVAHGRGPGAPDLPDRPAIALAAEERLRIAFRLPVEPADVFPEGDVRAVVPIWLVITGSRSVGPIVRRMNLPSFDEVDGGLASGWADVDVLRDPALPPGQQTFFAYAFSRAAMAGPAALKVEGGTTDPR